MFCGAGNALVKLALFHDRTGVNAQKVVGHHGRPAHGGTGFLKVHPGAAAAVVEHDRLRVGVQSVAAGADPAGTRFTQQRLQVYLAIRQWVVAGHKARRHAAVGLVGPRGDERHVQVRPAVGCQLGQHLQMCVPRTQQNQGFDAVHAQRGGKGRVGLFVHKVDARQLELTCCAEIGLL